MLTDGIQLSEGSSIVNAVISSGTAFPSLPSVGELFYRSDEGTMYVYGSGTWNAVGSGGGVSDANDLTGTTLAPGVVTSSLTTVGTLTSLAVSGNATAADPTTGAHLTTKSYVDNLVQGLSWKSAVRAATVGNISLTGTQTIDGVALAIGNRVLVKNQSTATQNGIYAVAAGTWARTADMDGAPDIGEVNGAAVFVTDGTTQADTAWTQTATITTVGTQAMTFAQLSGGAVNASTLTGTTLAAGVTGSSLTSVGTITSGTWSGLFGAVSGANLTALNASNLSTGTVAPARLGTGTANSGTVLRGDNTWGPVIVSQIPRSVGFTGTTADVGKRNVLSGSPTIPANVFAAGDVVSLYNNTSVSVTILQGAGLTLRQDGTTNTGNRQLAPYGTCLLWFDSATVCVISGSIT